MIARENLVMLDIGRDIVIVSNLNYSSLLKYEEVK